MSHSSVTGVSNEELYTCLTKLITLVRLEQLKLRQNRAAALHVSQFLADRTNGRAYATVLGLSVVCLSSVTLCIVAKRCVLEQKLHLLTTYRKSYMRNRLVPK